MQRIARRTFAVVVTLVSMGATASAAWATPGSLGPPPWNGALCPAVGFDTGCEYGVDVTSTDASGAAAAVTIARDATQRPYEGVEDAMIVVQNDDPAKTLTALTIGTPGTGDDIFGFDGDGLCNPDGGGNVSRGVPNNPPAGCPFGPTGYEGPGTAFTAISPDTAQGTVTFSPGLAPGQHAYFSLEVAPSFPPTFGGVNDWITSKQAASGQAPAANVTIASGTNATDTAVVNGPHGALSPPNVVAGDGTAAGSVVYTLFDDGACSGTPVYTSPSEPVTGGVAASSAPVGAALAPGRYYWLVSYSGDASNSPTSSLCGDETLGIGSTTLTTKLSASVVTPGTGVTDTAFITGASSAGTATGKATFTVFSDPACTTQVGAAETDAVQAGTVTSSRKVLPAGGPYYFVVSYSGDAANAPATSACGSASLVVRATPDNTITLGRPRINRSTGVIRIKARVVDPGSLSWRLTYRACKIGGVSSGHKCHRRTFVYGRFELSIPPGVFTIKIAPGSAIAHALRRGKTFTLAARFTFQSKLGGTPGHRSAKLVVRGRKAKHHPKH